MSQNNKENKMSKKLKKIKKEEKYNYKLDKRITNREFKLLLKPEHLDRHREVDAIKTIVQTVVEKAGLEFSTSDTISSGMRNIYFYDTEDDAFHRNKLILRVRESRSDAWTDDWCEVTMKCRSEDRELAFERNPVPSAHLPARVRFKEEILKAGPIGSIRRIFSHNAILDAVPLDKVQTKTIEELSVIYPALKDLNLPFEKKLHLVGGKNNKILEACVTLGTIVFSPTVHAHCELAIWFKSVGEPLVGELAFAYRVKKNNRKDAAAHKKADELFKCLQHMFSQHLFNGTTKTALLYGKKE